MIREQARRVKTVKSRASAGDARVRPSVQERREALTLDRYRLGHLSVKNQLR